MSRRGPWIPTATWQPVVVLLTAASRSSRRIGSQGPKTSRLHSLENKRMAFFDLAAFKQLPILSDRVGVIEGDGERMHVHLGLRIDPAVGIEVELKRLFIR